MSVRESETTRWQMAQGREMTATMIATTNCRMQERYMVSLTKGEPMAAFVLNYSFPSKMLENAAQGMSFQIKLR